MITFTSLSDYDAVTHGGTHHADEIFGMVLLEGIFTKIRILRIPYKNRIKKIKRNAIIFDTLGGKFDHHQRGGNGSHELQIAGKLPIPYASFGLLWKEYGKQFLSKIGITEAKKLNYVFENVELNLVRGIDAADNGIFPLIPEDLTRHRIFSISAIISMLNEDDKTRPEDDNLNEGLLLSIKIARKILENAIEKAVSTFEQNGLMPEQVEKYYRLVNDYISSEIYAFLGKTYEKVQNEDFVELWEKQKETICTRLYGEERKNEAIKYLDGIIYGLKYDIDGVSYSYNSQYDLISLYTLRQIFSRYNFSDSDNSDDEFLKAILSKLKSNILRKVRYKVESKSYVEKEILKQSGKRILILDTKAYWQDYVSKMQEAKSFWFVVSPSDSNGWKIQPIPCKYTLNGYRKGFPTRWYGYNRNQKNPIVKLPKEVQFVHSQGFLALVDTKECALKLCELSFKENKS